MGHIRVLVVDSLLYADALKTILGDDGRFIIRTVTDPDRVEAELADFEAELILIDLEIGGVATCRLISQLTARFPTVRTIVFSLKSVDEAASALEAGAVAYINRRTLPESVAARLEDVALGKHVALRRSALSRAPRNGDRNRSPLSHLTCRELEVLQLLVDGYDNKSMASELDIRHNTVRTHVQNMLLKMGVNSRLRAVAVAAQEGFLPRQLDCRNGDRDKHNGTNGHASRHLNGVESVRRTSHEALVAGA
jgi:DNA-binding NarL/FixJ family response regulator